MPINLRMSAQRRGDSKIEAALQGLPDEAHDLLALCDGLDADSAAALLIGAPIGTRTALMAYGVLTPAQARTGSDHQVPSGNKTQLVAPLSISRFGWRVIDRATELRGLLEIAIPDQELSEGALVSGGEHNSTESGIGIHVGKDTHYVAGYREGKLLVNADIASNWRLRGDPEEALIDELAITILRLRSDYPALSESSVVVSVEAPVSAAGRIQSLSSYLHDYVQTTVEADVGIADRLEHLTSAHVLVGNDANLLALHEARQVSGLDNLVTILFWDGVGAGLVVDGRPLLGEFGEIGHLPYGDDVLAKCNCGSLGCLETVASARGIVSTVKQGLYRAYGAEHADAVAALGLPGVMALVNDAKQELGSDIVHQVVRKVAIALARVAAVVRPGAPSRIVFYGPKEILGAESPVRAEFVEAVESTLGVESLEGDESSDLYFRPIDGSEMAVICASIAAGHAVMAAT
jgi:predicted NBD/HSP70 family sugar kinase